MGYSSCPWPHCSNGIGDLLLGVGLGALSGVLDVKGLLLANWREDKVRVQAKGTASYAPTNLMAHGHRTWKHRKGQVRSWLRLRENNVPVSKSSSCAKAKSSREVNHDLLLHFSSDAEGGGHGCECDTGGKLDLCKGVRNEKVSLDCHHWHDREPHHLIQRLSSLPPSPLLLIRAPCFFLLPHAARSPC